MDYIYGRLNKEVELQEYKGLSTKTIRTIVDNSNHTISAELLVNNDLIDVSEFLSFKKKQNLDENQLKTVRDNIGLKKYLDDEVILQNKLSQMINGDLLVNNNLRTRGRYISVNINNTALAKDETAGLYIKNYFNDLDARVYITDDGHLRFDNEMQDRELVTSNKLQYNKFTYYDGYSLTSRDILPKDINTKNYFPSSDIDLVTKQYVDRSMRQNMNYAIVANEEEFNRLNAWEGRRVLVLEEVKA